MISGSPPCFPNVSHGSQLYCVAENHMVSSSLKRSSGSGTQSNSLLYSLSLLKDKFNQVQSLVSILISPNQIESAESTAIAVASMGTLVQEIIVTASSMLFTCQQMALGSTPATNNVDESQNQPIHSSRVIHVGEERGQGFYSGDAPDWYGENYNSFDRNDTISDNNGLEKKHLSQTVTKSKNLGRILPMNFDIVELDAADLLAKYTHYCHVCGKGFKRDANLRMHMRAHGDEYKSSAALSNPMKKNNERVNGDKDDAMAQIPRKYSCPQEGCRWNRKHAKFQPLKSVICAKNHYKRSHCPKIYVCKRCNQKQFSVLSDLRTHEKHCGDLKWQCSCGTTFSRKDKLMGHVALFVGHTPMINSTTKI